MGIDQATFRRVMGHFASGVTVVTACNNGVCNGITVSAFCSLSLEPPLALICISRRSSSHDLIREGVAFAVNMLAEDGEGLSRHFASPAPDKFETVAFHTGKTGAPLLDGALATIECRLVESYPGGDHTIFIGEVLAADSRDQGRPLLYYRGGYRQLD